MANGLEDLHEKNKEKPELSKKYAWWMSFQGREDAEMLQEKSASWTAKKANRGDFDSWGEES